MTSGSGADIPISPVQRASMAASDRLVTMTLAGGGVGALFGGYLGGQQSGRQYLAERAHRLPTTVAGWFFYQKWKNYRVIMGALKGAAKYGPRLGGSVLAFGALEYYFDWLVGEAQLGSSVLASAMTAVGVSLISRLPKSSARRAILGGLGVGAVVGAAQDFGRWKTGRPPAYLVWAQQRLSPASMQS